MYHFYSERLQVYDVDNSILQTDLNTDVLLILARDISGQQWYRSNDVYTAYLEESYTKYEYIYFRTHVLELKDIEYLDCLAFELLG